MSGQPTRNLALELVRVTEAAAMAAARFQGKGNKDAVDQAAVDAMRRILATVDMDGVVVIGEGEKDEAPMLFNGESVGNGSQPAVDVAVDPVDGTRLTALGLDGALAVLALAERGSMYAPGSLVYMNKIAVGPKSAGAIDINAPVAHNLAQVAKARAKSISDVTAIILDRPRNQEIIAAVRSAGSRIKLISDGDISAAISTCKSDSGVDILLGIGGSPEAVTSACALIALGGEQQCKLWPRDEMERQYAVDHDLDVDQVLSSRDLVNSTNTFFAATGVTSGDLLDGVRFDGDKVRTHSLVLRSETGTVRFVEAVHNLKQLNKLAEVAY